MPEEEKVQGSGAQENAPAEGGQAEEAPAKPKKVIPKVPKGKFKKPEKPNLGAAKGQFVMPKEGPVKKQSLDRFAKKSGMSKNVLFAIIGVAAVLVILYLILGAGTSRKNHTAYRKAFVVLNNNPDLKEKLGTPMHDPGTPKFTEGTDDKGRNTVEIEHVVGGPKGSAPFKMKGSEYKGTWEVLYLEVTIAGSTDVLINKHITEKGIMRKGN